MNSKRNFDARARKGSLIGWTIRSEFGAPPMCFGNVDEEFEFHIFPSPEELDQAIRAKVNEGRTARLTAGFCWPWSAPRSGWNASARCSSERIQPCLECEAGC